MLNPRIFTPLALVAGLLASVAAPATVMAQQAYAYQNPFDDGDDLTMNGLWACDSTPSIGANNAPGASGGNSLNWNNGTNFTGGTLTGTARTSTINLTGATSASMSFYCWYNTEAGGTYDQKWVRIFNANSQVQVYQVQVYSGAAAPGNCSGLSAWHQHTWTTSTFPPAALGIPIQVEFFFNAVDGAGNDGQGWFVDDLVIISADTTPPVPIDDLAASVPTLAGCKLDWSAPFDDDTSGTAASYDLRYATVPINAGNFASATPISGEPLPGPEDTPHTVTLAGLSAGTTYYFAIKSTDFAGNVSAISNVATITTLAPPSTGGGSVTGPAAKEDRYANCAAGTTAGPIGLMALAVLIGFAAAFRSTFRK